MKYKLTWEAAWMWLIFQKIEHNGNDKFVLTAKPKTILVGAQSVYKPNIELVALFGNLNSLEKGKTFTITEQTSWINATINFERTS
jgi:hypothetical protein